MHRVKTVIKVFVLVLLCCASTVATQAKPPNIVLILADDMGYGDLRCYNSRSKISTPNLDRLASEGMRFTDAHAPACLCVPTRYGLLTGRYPHRTDVWSGNQSVIEAERLTLPAMLRDGGYTTACIGKWHLGFRDWRKPKYDQPIKGGPSERGFDYFFGLPASLDIPPYYYIENDRVVAAPTLRIQARQTDGWSPIQGEFWRAGGIAPGFQHAEVLPEIISRSVRYLRQHGTDSKPQPFFLYVALTAPHTPWLPANSFVGKSEAGLYGDFTMQVDEGVGQILTTLEDQNLTKDTIVLFTSDNGPVWYDADERRFGHHSTGPYRGMKGDAWEGGHRMPLIVRWPGNVQPGGISDALVCHTDFMATIAAMTGRQLPVGAADDSISFLSVLLGKQDQQPIRENLVIRSARRLLAVRQGPWKMITGLGSGGFTKPAKIEPTRDGPRGQLYNLDEDSGEERNLWSSRPEIVQSLTQLLN